MCLTNESNLTIQRRTTTTKIFMQNVIAYDLRWNMTFIYKIGSFVWLVPKASVVCTYRDHSPPMNTRKIEQINQKSNTHILKSM